MELIKKGNNKLKSFWVESYNEADKIFFESLGFKEDKRMFMGEIMHQSLNYRGTKSFGWWDYSEVNRIYNATKKYLGVNRLRIRKLTLAELM